MAQFQGVENPFLPVQDRDPSTFVQGPRAPNANPFISTVPPSAPRQGVEQFAPDVNPFASRTQRLVPPGIAGFSPRPDDSTILENAGEDILDIWRGLKAMYDLVDQNGVDGIGTILGAVPGALIQTVTRWIDAADKDVFWEMARKHPVEFIQDFTLPIAPLFTGGGALVAKAFGTGATAGRVAKTLQYAGRATDVLGQISDPIGNTAAIAIRNAGGAALRAAMAKPKIILSKQVMSIDLLDDAAPTKGVMGQMRDTYDRYRTAIVDANHPITMAIRRGEQAKIRAETGETVPTRQLSSTKSENMVRTLAGYERVITQALDGGKKNPDVVRGVRDPNDLTQPIVRDPSLGIWTDERFSAMDIVEELGASNLKDARDYKVARRVLYDLSREGRQGAAQGFDLAAARRVVEKFDPKLNPDANPDIHNAFVKGRQYGNDQLDAYQQSGLIDQQTKNEYKTRNPNWTSFSRSNRIRVQLTPDQKQRHGITEDHVVLEAPAGEPVRVTGAGSQELRNPKQIIKELSGSLRMLRDPFVSEGLIWSRMMQEGEHNRIFNEIKQNFADVPGSGITLEPLPAGIKSKVTMSELDRAMDAEGILDDVTISPDSVIEFNSPMLKPLGVPDNVVIGYENGRPYALKFDDPAVAQSFATMRFKPNSGLDSFINTRLGAFAKTVAKIQRAGITSAPGFAVLTNPVRDAWQAMGYSPAGFVPVFDNLRAVSAWFNENEVFDLWVRSGGAQAHLSAIDTPILKKNLEKFMAPANRSYVQKMAHLVKSPLEALQLMQEVVETSTRLGVFERNLRKDLGINARGDIKQALNKARESGADVDGMVRQASVHSRDASTDFGRRGANPELRALNSITPFNNAGIQGLDLFRGKIWEGPLKQRLMMGVRLGMSVTIPSLIFAGLNWNDPVYEDMQQFEKDLFWIVKIGDQHIRIVKPLETGMLFGTLPVRMIESIAHADPSIFTKSAARMVWDLQPIGIPTLFKSPTEIALDKNFFFGGDLTPAGQKRFPKSQQRFETTSEFAKGISQFTDWVSNGKSVASPIKIDHLVRGFGGTLAGLATQLTDPAIRSARGIKNEKSSPKGPIVDLPILGETALGGVPILNRTTANRNNASAARNAFWKIYAESERASNAIKDVGFEGNRERFLKDNANLIAMAPLFRKQARVIMRLGNESRSVEFLKMTRFDKRRLRNKLEEAKNEAARRIMKVWKDLENGTNN